MRVFHGRLSVCVGASLSFGFEDGMWDWIVLTPDHCLSIYFSCLIKQAIKKKEIHSVLWHLFCFT